MEITFVALIYVQPLQPTWALGRISARDGEPVCWATSSGHAGDLEGGLEVEAWADQVEAALLAEHKLEPGSALIELVPPGGTLQDIEEARDRLQAIAARWELPVPPWRSPSELALMASTRRQALTLHALYGEQRIRFRCPACSLWSWSADCPECNRPCYAVAALVRRAELGSWDVWRLGDPARATVDTLEQAVDLLERPEVFS